MMTQEEYGRLLDGAEIAVTSECPACHQRGKVTIRRVLRAKDIGTFSLAGAQMKFSATDSLEATCGGCGWRGPAVPKEPADSGREQ